MKKRNKPTLNEYKYENTQEKSLALLKISKEYIKHMQLLINEAEEKIDTYSEKTKANLETIRSIGLKIPNGSGSSSTMGNGNYSYFTSTTISAPLTPNELNLKLQEISQQIENLINKF